MNMLWLAECQHGTWEIISNNNIKNSLWKACKIVSLKTDNTFNAFFAWNGSTVSEALLKAETPELFLPTAMCNEFYF